MNFLNTFFIGSVLTSVVLVAMMLYHFRQRMNSLETRVSTLLEIVNNIVTKLNIQEMDLTQHGGPVISPHEYRQDPRRVELQLTEESESEDEEESEEDYERQENNQAMQIVFPDSFVDHEESIEDEESDGEESGDEESDGEESGDEESVTGEPVTDTMPEQDIIENIDEFEEVVEIIEEPESAQEPEPEPVQEPEPEMKVSIPPGYERMTVSELKELVSSRKLASYAYKMRRAELLEVIRANM